jgi:hypothetical protein
MGVFLFFVLIAGACVWAFWGFSSGVLGGLSGAEGRGLEGREVGGSASDWRDAALFSGFTAFTGDTDDAWATRDEAVDRDDFDMDDADYDSHDAADYGDDYGDDYGGDYGDGGGGD